MSRFYKIIEHPSDLFLEVKGKSKPELLTNSFRALTEILVENIGPIKKVVKNKYTYDGDMLMRIKTLLSDFLFELYNGRIFKQIITYTENESTTNLDIEIIEPATISFLYEAKAITYHQLKLWHKSGTYYLRFLVDL